MSTMLADPISPVTTATLEPTQAAGAPPAARAADRFALFFWLGCAGALTWLLLIDMARWLL